MSKWLRRIAIALLILGLVITNVLTLTSTAFNAAMTGLVATAIGVKTATGMLHRQIAAHKTKSLMLEKKIGTQRLAVKKMGQRLVSRTRRIAAYSVSEIPASILPYAGLAILVTGTAWELKLLCDGLQDIETLYAQMEIEEPLDGETLRAVCHPSSWLNKK